LSGKECNPKNLSDPSAGDICVNDEAKEVAPYDPNHSFAATTERIFGCEFQKTNNTPCTNMKMDDGNATMIGFASSAIREGKDGENELSMWPPQKVPIITTLAKEFALFDRFFAAHPGSTYPNRQFVMSGTAHGMTDTGNKVFC
jgi:phospholipase C